MSGTMLRGRSVQRWGQHRFETHRRGRQHHEDARDLHGCPPDVQSVQASLKQAVEAAGGVVVDFKPSDSVKQGWCAFYYGSRGVSEMALIVGHAKIQFETSTRGAAITFWRGQLRVEWEGWCTPPCIGCGIRAYKPAFDLEARWIADRDHPAHDPEEVAAWDDYLAHEVKPEKGASGVRS